MSFWLREKHQRYDEDTDRDIEKKEPSPGRLSGYDASKSRSPAGRQPHLSYRTMSSVCNRTYRIDEHTKVKPEMPLSNANC